MAPQEKITQLRKQLAKHKLDGWMVPRCDEHQGEYVAAYAERLAWLTGFDGSAGSAIVLKDKAAVFVDGRYTLQAAQQVDTDLYEIVHIADTTVGQWLAQNAPGLKIAFDPWLQTEAEIQSFQTATKGLKTQFIAHEKNLVDKIWTNQPTTPKDMVVVHDAHYAGQESSLKRKAIAAALKSKNIDAAVLTNLDSIAWLLNIRGRDIPNTPLVLANAILKSDGTVDLFVESQKITEEIRAHLGLDVRLFPYEKFNVQLSTFAGRTVTFDPRTAPVQVWFNLKTAGANLVRESDVCTLPKALKNEVEVEGMRRCHIRDGVALTKYMFWISQKVKDETVTEIEGVEKLLAFRQEQDKFQQPSFDTISGSGPNGAIVHYRVTPQSDRTIEKGDIYLVDSGGQYLDGTTDVTRTLCFETPDPEVADRYTRVLKGHIAVATAVFPVGTSGAQLDSYARQFLWEIGCDYAHGTGHGVGSYLCVHEGPQGISKGYAQNVALQPGMILSNEPGYYKTDAYGIRIESLVAVKPIEMENAEQPMLGFETLTMAPLCRDLIKVDLLTDTEKQWINAYHSQVVKNISERLSDVEKAWLMKETAEF